MWEFSAFLAILLQLIQEKVKKNFMYHHMWIVFIHTKIEGHIVVTLGKICALHNDMLGNAFCAQNLVLIITLFSDCIIICHHKTLLAIFKKKILFSQQQEKTNFCNLLNYYVDVFVVKLFRRYFNILGY